MQSKTLAANGASTLITSPCGAVAPVSSDAVGSAGKKHGYVFEVTADPAQTTGQHLPASR